MKRAARRGGVWTEARSAEGRRRTKAPRSASEHGGLLIWAVAVFAYMVAVFHRTSLAVAGVTAAHRFGINASLLGLLSVAQIAMYAAMQVPVGVLLDRFGSRRLLLTGTALMAVGQLGFAFTASVPLAIAARLLIGFGDAMMFISVLRLIAQWLPPRRNPVFVQLTGVLGQSGALLSAVPVVLLLRDAGWTVTYLSAAALGSAVFGLVALAVRDGPVRAPVATGRPRATVRAAWAEPGTRLGLWTHFVTQFSGFTFGLLWGYPFLVEGEGLAPATAALLLSTLNVMMLVGGPVVGHLCGRLPYRRSVLVLGIAGASATAWTAVLLWPGRAPLWLLVVLVTVLAVNGPGSMIAFDYARTFNPAGRLGSASGIVNVGGFCASILLILGIGAVLDAFGAERSLTAFRWAFALQYLLWTVGAVQVLRYRNAARRKMSPEDLAALRRGVLPVPA
jgi:MFS family permease